jgi:hypothetical protein
LSCKVNPSPIGANEVTSSDCNGRDDEVKQQLLAMGYQMSTVKDAMRHVPLTAPDILNSALNYILNEHNSPVPSTQSGFQNYVISGGSSDALGVG